MWPITMLEPGPSTETGPGRRYTRKTVEGLPGGSETILTRTLSVEQLARLIREIEVQKSN